MSTEKSNILFFSPERCSGCKACEMICSLYKTGNECNREASCIHVSTHPYLYSSVISVGMDCDCEDGKERCTDICSQDAIMFLEKTESPSMLKSADWLPSPVIASTSET